VSSSRQPLVSSSSPPSEPVPVVCALIEDDAGRVLVARRSAHKHLGGLWEFPGGKIEPGESSETALVREILEELGCEVTFGRSLQPCRHDYGAGAIWVELIPFIARLVPTSPPPRAIEHTELSWVSAAELAELDLAMADRLVAAQWIENGQKPPITNAIIWQKK